MLVILFRLRYHKVRHPFWFEFGCGDLIIPDFGAFFYVKLVFFSLRMLVFSRLWPMLACGKVELITQLSHKQTAYKPAQAQA